MSGEKADPGEAHTSSDKAHDGADIEQNQPDNLAAWTTRMREGMARMATNEEERLKVAKRLF